MRTLAFLFALGLAAPALAQDTAQEFRQIDFTDGDTIEGTLVSPTVDLIGGHRRAARHTLVQARRGFLPELVTSVEDL